MRGNLTVGPHRAVLQSLRVTKGEMPVLKLIFSVRKGEPEKTMLQFLRDHLSKRVTLELGYGPASERQRVKLRLREFVPAYWPRTVRIETGWGVQ